MNKIILMGRLTRDPNCGTSGAGTAYARFSIAVDRRFRRDGEPDADFFNCSAFGKTAEFVQNYLHKGVKIALSGRLENDSYTNRDGVKVSSTQVMVDELEFAESKRASEDYQNSHQNNDAAAGDASYQDGFVKVDSTVTDDIPF